MNISAIIVVFNPKLTELLKHISTYKFFVSQIVIVDNSNDLLIKGKVETLCLNNRFDYIDMKGNKGIASALNVGFNYVIKGGADWILTMDQDSYFVSNFDGFKAYLQYGNISNLLLLAPIYSNHESLCTSSDKITYPKIVIQSGNLVNAFSYIKLGPYREDFFIDFVDYEYCLRGISNKMTISQIHSVILKHSPGENSIGNFLGLKYNYWSSVPIRYYYVIRNGLLTAFLYRQFWCIGIVIKTIFRVILLEKCKKVKLFYIYKGFADFLLSKYGKFSESI